MADLLDFERAKSLARLLKSIPGFPWDEENVKAAAEDLVTWCQGRIFKRKVWSADDQATWLVDEVRRIWTEWQGPGAMLRVYRTKFEPEKLGLERQVYDSKKYGKPESSAWTRALLGAAGHKEQMAELRRRGIWNSLYYVEGPGRNEISPESLKDWEESLERDMRKHPEQVAALRAEIARIGWVDDEQNLQIAG